jgi:hypothetical protein
MLLILCLTGALLVKASFDESFHSKNFVKRQADNTLSIVADALSRYYSTPKFSVPQLATPKASGVTCKMYWMDHCYFMANILGEVPGAMDKTQCAEACSNTLDCVGVNLISTNNKCVLLASLLPRADYESENWHDSVVSDDVNVKHAIITDCVDSKGQLVNRTPKPIGTPALPGNLAGTCGKSVVQPIVPDQKMRITNGNEAVPHSWPWMAGLRNKASHACGGSLIRVSSKDESDMVLTAAHCVNPPTGPQPLDKFSVIFGNHDHALGEFGEVQVPVEKYVWHPEYSIQGLIGDVAVIKLKYPVKFSKTIIPICLAKPGDKPDPNSLCVVAGWGNTKEVKQTEGMPNKLQQLKVPVWDDSICTKNEVWGPTFNTTARICTGYLSGGRNVCSGDSGGPMVCGVNGQFTQYGVASYVSSTGCTVPNKPGVFARVTTYYQWIVDRVKEMSKVGSTVSG